MIGKIRKGRSFSGCIRYVTQKDDAKIIASEGVLLGMLGLRTDQLRNHRLMPGMYRPQLPVQLS